ncbi:MAG: flavin reductase family protein [Dehalococcoidia bacterium]
MAIDVAGYRRIIGHFATGVTVVTTAVDGWLHGMTANAFASLSLEPIQVLVCVDKTTHAHQEFEKASHFGVNILAEDQEDLSNLFASKAPPEQGSLRGMTYHFGPNGTPIFEGALAYLECAVGDRLAGGDHTIFLGEVLDGDILREAAPLLFYQGRYRQMEG